ncbi:hypothetical protein GCM10028895_34660 [Pontibacter rugosus]
MSVTIILIIITVGISLYAWQNESLMHKWIFQPYAVQRDNSWYRFITSGFLHADFTHLLFNMFTLFFFGDVVELVFKSVYGDTTGVLLYLLVYLGGIIVSDIPTFLSTVTTRLTVRWVPQVVCLLLCLQVYYFIQPWISASLPLSVFLVLFSVCCT